MYASKLLHSVSVQILHRMYLVEHAAYTSSLQGNLSISLWLFPIGCFVQQWLKIYISAKVRFNSSHMNASP